MVGPDLEQRPTLISICSGAFFLGLAGLLDGRRCTTHWKRCELLQKTFPRAVVLDERLFVQDGSIYTSGGGASVIDLALHLIDQDHGPLMAAKVAREMVVFFRRGRRLSPNECLSGLPVTFESGGPHAAGPGEQPARR